MLESKYGKVKTELKDGIKRVGSKYIKVFMKMGKHENNKYFKEGHEGIKFRETKEHEEDDESEEA